MQPAGPVIIGVEGATHMPGDGRKLVRSISARQFFAMSFGSVVGVGWIVVLGDAVGHPR